MSFSQIKGQRIPIKILLNSLNKGILSPSYIFTGPEGVGKTMTALNFAKAVNCLKSKDGDCCDECICCLKIKNFNHPDVCWIRKDSTGSIKIETIRDLQKNIYLKPWEAKRKVFIIQEAESLTPEAQNSLLKTLEDPPKENLLILITCNLSLIFPTLVSRCKRINFSSLNPSSLKEILVKDFNLKEPEAHFLAYFCEGRLGKAIEFKEKDIFKKRNSVLSFFLEERFNFLDIPFELKADFSLILSILLSWFRDLLILKKGLLDFPLLHLDQTEKLFTYVDRYQMTELEDIYRILKDAALYKEFNVNPKLILNYIKVTTAR